MDAHEDVCDQCINQQKQNSIRHNFNDQRVFLEN